ncbi:MAG: UDP-glucose 6-dehydrogenase [Hydrocarboniphaga sp.]|uniref:UDP-glucose dehydrogenase family protein n=1 Tax=Hydrocarboniphaga sp. TaxID=2033016 RepID=UPI002635EEDE|nr:UDP-glucose/GDP-mannose dehydrogenase family protein [Hydrocarboniphaga sp.]MDB5969795.1 UDP-glucose 6-dehydrogenase [Hydrocarboniphaga sp.]
MNITIFGSGYVGLVTAACFADAGNDVLCVDVDPAKVERLRRGECPIYEPGLEDMLQRNVRDGRMRFTIDAGEGVAHGTYQFIAVGTPPNEDGSADMQYVLAVANSIGQHMDQYRVVISKSTVPVGTADRVQQTLAAALAARGVSVPFDVVSNPEFLKEGAAVADFNKPDRIIVGASSERAADAMHTLYAPFNRNHDKLIVMDVRSSELTKYAANAMLATKISFMNEIANLAEALGADVEKVRVGIGADPRIGYHFIYPGCGYGGSCFPKDVKALVHTAGGANFDAQLLQAVESVNNRQKTRVYAKLEKSLGSLRGMTIALWGLAFKPLTDDMREAPSRDLMEAVWAAGGTIRAYDPVASHECLRLYGERPDLILVNTPEAACDGADALAIVTEWRVFHSPNFARLKTLLKNPVIVDGRNLYEPEVLKQAGFHYYAIGRGEI